MNTHILFICILVFLALVFFAAFILARYYEIGNKDKNDWFFHNFSEKLYNALCGNKDPDVAAMSIGINVEKYIQGCKIVRKTPNTKRLVMCFLYGLVALAVFAVLSIFTSLYMLLIGFVIFFFFTQFEKSLIDSKMKSMTNQITDELPRFLGILQTELAIGMPIETAITIISNKMPGLLSKEFREAMSKSDMGAGSWQDAMEEVAERYNVETLSDFVMNVSTSYKRGIDISETVTRKAFELRSSHLLLMKEKAGKTSNTILIPIAIFQFVPLVAFFIIPSMVTIMNIL